MVLGSDQIAEITEALPMTELSEGETSDLLKVFQLSEDKVDTLLPSSIKVNIREVGLPFSTEKP